MYRPVDHVLPIQEISLDGLSYPLVILRPEHQPRLSIGLSLQALHDEIGARLAFVGQRGCDVGCFDASCKICPCVFPC